CLLFFFFSSRRRHTRSKRDWSSDVCSSDLFSSNCSTACSKHIINIKHTNQPAIDINCSYRRCQSKVCVCNIQLYIRCSNLSCFTTTIGQYVLSCTSF